MKKKELIAELQRYRDHEGLHISEAAQLDKAIDVLLSNYGVLNIVDGFTVGAATLEFGYDPDTDVLFCGIPGLPARPVTQKELDSAVEVLRSVHRKMEEAVRSGKAVHRQG